MLEQLISSLDILSLFCQHIIKLKKSSESNVTKAMVAMMGCLTSDFDHLRLNAEKIIGPVLPQKINNERDLYRVYAKSMKNTPTVINVDIDITFLEALSKFKVNFQLDDFVVMNVANQEYSPFRLLEEAVENATWLVCTGLQKCSDYGNLLDFLIKWLKTAKINDNFRFWIICEGIDALTLTTIQKCGSHYLGYEPPEPEEESRHGHLTISAFVEAKER